MTKDTEMTVSTMVLTQLRRVTLSLSMAKARRHKLLGEGETCSFMLNVIIYEGNNNYVRKDMR